MQVEFERASGRLTFSDTEMTGALIRSGMAWARYRLADGTLRNAPLTGLGTSIREEPLLDSHGNGGIWECNCPPNQDGIDLTYQIKSYTNRPFLLLRIALHNNGKAPIMLQNLCLFQASPSNGGLVRVGGPAEDYRFFKVGWHGWDYSGLCAPGDHNSHSWLDGLTRLSYSNPATPKPRGLGEFVSEGWGILAGKDSAVVAGFATTKRQFGQVYTSLRSGYEALMLISQLDGIRIDPGESSASEWGFLQFVPLPNDQPDSDFVDAVAREMQPRVPSAPPATMWTHWYQYYHDMDEQCFIHNMDELVKVRDNLPFQTVELDDGYQAAWGDWTSTNSRFPRGLAWLASEIRSRGFTPGLWLSPFAVQSKSTLAKQHPDWLVKDRRGRPGRVGFQYNMLTHALDLTHPEVLEHLRKLAHTLTREFGFGMLKLDFINSAALPGRRSDPKLTRAEALRKGLEAIREGAGEETFLLASGCPFGPAIGMVDAMRIGPDTAPNWKPYFHWLPWVGPLIKNNPSMPALRNATRATFAMSGLQRKWWWNDPDCVLMRDRDTHLSEAEARSRLSLVGLSGGMLVDSDDMQKVSPERQRWLSLLVPNLGLGGFPLDRLQHEIPAIYRASVKHNGQSWQLVGLFNWLDHPADYRLRVADLGYPAGTNLHVFDFWDGVYQRVDEPEIVFTALPAHGCKLLRLCEVGNAPQLVGDTLHISQGMELNSLRIANGVLKMETIDLGRRVEGEIWLALNEPPKEARCNGEETSIEEKGKEVYAVQVEFVGKAIIEVR